MKNNGNDIKTGETGTSPGQEKILLALLPFWDPQIPPLGIACLKSYLQQHGYRVKGMDANLDMRFREFHHGYFNRLETSISRDKTANIFNIGNQVFRNHLMAYINKEDQEQYDELLKILVQETFYTELDHHIFVELDTIISQFYILFEDYIVDVLNKEKPTVLGLSVYGDTFAPSLFAFKLAKKIMPSIRTVMGGGIFADQLAPGSPALDYFEEFSRDFIDKLIIGEGETLFLEYLRDTGVNARGHSKGNRKRTYMLGDLGTGTLDMAKVDVPDFSDFELVHYMYLAHYGGRSCPFQCKFCSETINWGKYRKKSVEQTLNEFIELYRRHSIQIFLMTDSTLNPIISALAREFIKSGASIYWDGFLRADKHVCNIDNTMLWRQGGFYRAKLGIESGSQSLLDLMKKEITVEQSEAALAALAYAGIKTTTFWLFGFPGETEDDFQNTLDYVERCKDNIYEADCNAFNYYLTGQVNSQQWLKNNKGVLLYPQWTQKLLVTLTWTLEGKPSRETAYRRLNRFVQHCEKMGIPNPYSLEDIHRADERWKRLHKNAVPAVIDLKNRDIYVEENKKVKKLTFAQAAPRDDDDDWF